MGTPLAVAGAKTSLPAAATAAASNAGVAGPTTATLATRPLASIEICRTTVAPRPPAISLGGNSAGAKVRSRGGRIEPGAGGLSGAGASGAAPVCARAPLAVSTDKRSRPVARDRAPCLLRFIVEAASRNLRQLDFADEEPARRA